MEYEHEVKKAAELVEKAKKVAEIMGFEMKKNDEPVKWGCSEIMTKGAEEVYIKANSSTKWRFELFGCYPRDNKGEYSAGSVYYTQEERAAGLGKANYGKVPQPSISVSSEKTAEQIAKDIERRFMPLYRDYLARVVEIVDASNDYQKTTAESLAIVKGAPLSEYEEKERKFSIWDNEGGPRYSAKASRKEIELTLSDLKPEEARRIVEILQAMRPLSCEAITRDSA